MPYDFLDDGAVHSHDAMAYADPLPDEDEPDVEAMLGFNCTTGTDVALRHEGMLALGLQLQEDYGYAD